MGLYGGLVIGFSPIIQYGTKSVKDKIIPAILRGEKRVCLAITEPTFGSDTKRLATTAQKTPDGKHYIGEYEIQAFRKTLLGLTSVPHKQSTGARSGLRMVFGRTISQPPCEHRANLETRAEFQCF